MASGRAGGAPYDCRISRTWERDHRDVIRRVTAPGSLRSTGREMTATPAWKQRGSTSRKQTAGNRAQSSHESPAIRRHRRSTKGDGSSLLAHGMQEVVGSSPTSSTHEQPANRLFFVSVQCSGSGEEGCWVAAVVGGEGVG
jgi:hypothetical protein